MYIDIDVHHGDGVEEAFYNTDRVLTLSFHEFHEGFFPESGPLSSKGKGEGMNYAVNVPFDQGMTGMNYVRLFKIITSEVVRKY